MSCTICGASGWTRTTGPDLRRVVLLPLSYRRENWIDGRGGRIRTCVHRVKAGCLRPLDYAPIDSGDELVPSVRVERTRRVAPASETGASAYSATRGRSGWMRLGVTGRSRTGTCGVTFRSSAIELRPHPSARMSCWSRRQVSNLRPDAPEASALPTALHRDEHWLPDVASNHGPPG